MPFVNDVMLSKLIEKYGSGSLGDLLSKYWADQNSGVAKYGDLLTDVYGGSGFLPDRAYNYWSNLSWAPPAVPPTISGLYHWWDATQITGKVENDTITTWADLSGNNRTLTAGAGTPKYRASGIGSLPSVEIGQTATSYLTAPALASGFPDFTCFIVAKITGGAGTNRRLFWMQSGTAGAFYGWYIGPWNTNVWRVGWALSSGTSAFSNGSPAVTLNENVVLVLRGTATTLKFWKNNTLDPSASLATTTYRGTAAGAVPYVGEEPTLAVGCPAYVSEIVQYNAALSDADRLTVQTYLASKYGITMA